MHCAERHVGINKEIKESEAVVRPERLSKKKSREGDMPGNHSFTFPPPVRNLLIAQRSQPQTLADNVRFDFEAVLGAGFEETKQVLDDGGGSVVTVEVYEAFAVDGGCVDEGGFLGVVD
jgi:hypothetical protein